MSKLVSLTCLRIPQSTSGLPSSLQVDHKPADQLAAILSEDMACAVKVSVVLVAKALAHQARLDLCHIDDRAVLGMSACQVCCRPTGLPCPATSDAYWRPCNVLSKAATPQQVSRRCNLSNVTPTAVSREHGLLQQPRRLRDAHDQIHIL